MRNIALPIMVIIVFTSCLYLVRRAKALQIIAIDEAASTKGVFVALAIWAVVCFWMGLRGIHAEPWLLEAVPLLWQSMVAVVIFMTWFLFSPKLRKTLAKVADHTPVATLVFIQALRIGAIGSILKTYLGLIVSNFPYWVGIPDFIFGLSALLIGALVVRGFIGHQVLAVWHIVGATIILLPLVGLMNYWMNEPGFLFIFEYPMILAPSLVVPVLISLNMFAAWASLRALQHPTQSKPSIAR